ncbi:hypothetical protein HPB47_003514 [Ixodes persulcatus]|uniref:Uncharacterized protein n=1 Tax=Ixodes persulcatus TaxID=34615 RepID=A0AC60PJC9_IXOPE|nr:hypothetical protein HPB47_003514 [Ixodes persulcatus]
MAADDNAANTLLQLVLEDDFEEFVETQRRAKRRRITESDSERIRGMEEFVSDAVPRYTDTQFKEHFRMYRSTFEVLLQLTEPNLAKTIGVRVPTATKVLMTLWLLGNQESYRGVADRFGVHKSTLHFVVYEIVLVWTRCAPSVIQWPTQLAQVTSQFERKWRFPGVVGAVDGCHEFHSVVLQGCCDSSMVFTHVHVGSPGRMNDARILTNSDLDDILSALPEDLYILGDSAYPLRVNLMSPYKDNGHLTRRQSHFNTTLGASRSVIERAFAQLKGKFRRLKHLDMDNLNMELEDPCLVRREPDVTRAPSAAKAKRDAIASLLHPACT